MNSTTETKPVNTEQLILKAAEREFLLKGYAGARTSAIAEAAGVTHAMLHYYFRTKDKLFDTILDRKIKLLRDVMLGSIGDADKPLFQKLADTVSNHIDFLAANPDLPRFMVNEIFYNPARMQQILPLMKAHAPQVVTNLQRQIDEMAARGECRRVDAAMLMVDIVSLNVFSFMAAPMVESMLGDRFSDRASFVEQRKRENIDTIMRKIRESFGFKSN